MPVHTMMGSALIVWPSVVWVPIHAADGPKVVLGAVALAYITPRLIAAYTTLRKAFLVSTQPACGVMYIPVNFHVQLPGRCPQARLK